MKQPVYDRAFAEAHLTLHGYVPVKLYEMQEETRVGIWCREAGMDHLIQTSDGPIEWRAALSPNWMECQWSNIPAAVMHNIWHKWRKRYEP